MNRYFDRSNGEIYLDVSSETGDSILSVEYPAGTSATKILTDIKKYFEDGTEPRVSTLAQFRYSLKGERQMQGDINRLREANERLREQMKTTKAPRTDRKGVAAITEQDYIFSGRGRWRRKYRRRFGNRSTQRGTAQTRQATPRHPGSGHLFQFQRERC